MQTKIRTLFWEKNCFLEKASKLINLFRPYLVVTALIERPTQTINTNGLSENFFSHL
jgi:hypothetical protein